MVFKFLKPNLVQAPYSHLALALLMAVVCTTWTCDAAIADDSVPNANSGSGLSSNIQTARDMLETISRLSEAAKDAVAEVSRYRQVMVSNEHVFYDLATATTSQPFAGPPEEEDVGPALPPRKKWIDYDVERMQKLFSMLKTEVASLTVPAQGKRSKDDEIRAQLDVAQDSLSSINNQLIALQSLTVGPDYDNAKISAAATKIQSSLSGLNIVRKRVIHLY